jgi:hypothetical protein
MGEPADKSDDNTEVVSHDQFADPTVIKCHGVYGELEDHPGGPTGRRCGCYGGFLGNKGERCRRSYAVPDAGEGATMICGHYEEYHYSDY